MYRTVFWVLTVVFLALPCAAQTEMPPDVASGPAQAVTVGPMGQIVQIVFRIGTNIFPPYPSDYCSYAAEIFPDGSFYITVIDDEANTDGICDFNAEYWNLANLSYGATGFPNAVTRRAVAANGPGSGGHGSQGVTSLVLANGQTLNAWLSTTALMIAPIAGNSGGLQPTGNYTVGPTPASVISADFNGDGNADLAVSNFGNLSNNSGGNIQIFLGKGDGTFIEGATVNAGATPAPMYAADVNGDGKLDLVAGNQTSSSFSAGSLSVLLGNGDGTFQPSASIPLKDVPSSLVVVDLNGDGKLDIAVLNRNTATVSIFPGNGDGTFAPGTLYPAGTGRVTYLAATDVNGDGKPDLIVANPDANAVCLLFGNGDGSFQAPVSYVTGANPQHFAVITGVPQLLISTLDGISGNIVITPVSTTGLAGAPQLYAIPRGGTSFPIYGVTGIAAADLNGDKLPDIVAAQGSVSVLLRKPGAAFNAPVSYALQSGSQAVTVAVADFNGDGKEDVVASSTAASGGTVDVALGNGDGTLGAQNSSALGGYPGGNFTKPSGIVVGDFNGDGKPDVAAGFQSPTGTTTPGGISVLLGNGDGTLRPAVNTGVGSFSVFGLVAADFNGDGKLDIAAAAGNENSSTSTPGALAILLGNGDGTFKTAAMSQVGSPAGTPIALATADVNGDGKPDLLISVNSTIVVLLGIGDGTFRTLSPIILGKPGYAPAGNALAIADLNGDGLPDLVVSDCCGLSESVYLLGNGDGTFQTPQYFNSGSSVTAFAVTDWNNNGVAGLAVAQAGGTVMAMQSGLNPKLLSSNTLTSVSSVPGVTALAPGSLATAYGTNLATATASAQTTPLPLSLSGTSVAIQDSIGNVTPGPLLYVSSTQVNYLIPGTVAIGPATIFVASGSGMKSSGQVNLAKVAPALFTLNSSNLAAANAVCVLPGGAQMVETVYQVINGAVTAAPINLNGCTQTVLQLYGTGMDSVSTSEVQATIGGASGSVAYAGPQGTFVGLDQINITIPNSLAGSGNVPVVVSAGGQAANTVNITIQ